MKPTLLHFCEVCGHLFSSFKVPKTLIVFFTSVWTILWYTEEFMVDSMAAWCPGRVTAKQAQIITPPPQSGIVW